ncbi:MAG TPA: allophanate hydrolase subunit 1 [Candidatus Limnocylindrales bacterium]|nr:allophanate hydrolase subunit 1 [Candidatus Limnocylindrales bacterium]
MIRPFGEAALLVELESADHAQALAAALRAEPPPGVIAAVPGLASLVVELHPLMADADRVAASIERLLHGELPPPPIGPLRIIPVVYDGPDLEAVAELTGLAASDVVARHAATELGVLFCGFAPGFAYLGDLAPELHVERLATPRTHTPAGSVAIAGSMSGIYPADLPGGWRVIGRTDIVLFDPRRDPPALLAPGDRVRFEPA